MYVGHLSLKSMDAYSSFTNQYSPEKLETLESHVVKLFRPLMLTVGLIRFL
ncbi:hypothetical protein F2Q69_00025375 [Brassica cretica]|uniref:Uncharacterized protein n=1 Tax=Brassica cretica TaxID=69181 RepID=A0A8S9Q6H0_BRACR|nr:hypothetical protein F2Q69_00025375 [Brassica cretica]